MKVKRYKPPFQEILDFFKDYDFPKEPFQLSVCETVLDCEKAVKTFIRILKANPGKKSMMPYYWHLVDIYEYLIINEI